MTEEQLQRQVAELLDYHGWLWSHVPNEGKRSKAAGGRLKAQGMKRGVPDVLVFERWEAGFARGMGCTLDRYSGHGIAIELKVGKRKPTPEQEQWMEALRERGWMVAVCRSLEEVRDVLRHCRPRNGRRSG
jgi:hypothetical protein